MSNINIYTQDGKVKETMSLSGDVYTLPWNDSLVHQVVTSIEAQMRSGTAHTKIRKEVRGGGKKPWKQKGTGRARHGSTRSPIWTGGGVTFGPRNTTIFTRLVNKKARAKAFFTVLSKKIRDDSIVFVEDINIETPSTKAMIPLIDNVCGDNAGVKNRCLVVFPGSNELLRKSLSNIPGVSSIALEALNTRDIMIARKVLFVQPEKTISYLDERSKNVRTVKEVEVIEK